MDPVQLLRDLIAIPSVNPRDAKSFASPFGEAEVVSYVEALLGREGIDAERQPVAAGRDNLIARAEGANPGKTLLLECHADTVAAEGWEADAFRPVERDGRVHGRGACDAKAQLAAMLAGLIRASNTRRLPHPVALAVTVGEEYNYLGAAALVRSGIAADAAVVGEPTELTVVTAHKGAVRLRCATTGKAAHSSDPSTGVSAIYRMASVIRAVEEHGQELLKGPRHPLLGTGTLSVGSIRGGRDVNVVPDHCSIEIDRRLIPGEEAEIAALQMERAVTERPEIDFPVRFQIVLRDPAMELAIDAPIVRAMCRASEKALGWCRTGVGHYGTDASKLAAAGIPSVVFGAGSVKQAHTVDEYVEIEQVKRAARVFETLLLEGL